MQDGEDPKRKRSSTKEGTAGGSGSKNKQTALPQGSAFVSAASLLGK